MRDRGYMVAYDQRIPGTQAVIKMLPVPGGIVTLKPLPPLDAFKDGRLVPEKVKITKGADLTVTIKPFWISQHEITMAQYMPYRKLYYKQKKAERESRDLGRRQDLPAQDEVDAVSGPTEPYDATAHFEWAKTDDSAAVSMTQFAARQHTKWLSLILGDVYRLPLRSEWKHACLAGTKASYCFGDDENQLGTYALYFDNSDTTETLTVGTKQPNAWGIHDMHGNAGEFVIEDTAKTGLEWGHVVCGGDMESDPDKCTADSVIRTDEDWKGEDPDFPPSCWWMTTWPATLTGFRIVRPLDDSSPEQKKVYWDADHPELVNDLNMRIEGGRGSIGRVKKTAK